MKDQLNERNWADWERQIMPVLKVLKVWNYVTGLTHQLDAMCYSKSTENWDSNDDLAKLLVLQNVSHSQLQHIDQDQTATQVWSSLSSLL